MDEKKKKLFKQLKTFTSSQFVSLRNEVDLTGENFPLNATPVELADLFITFVKQRNDDDLSALEKAVNNVIIGKAVLELQDEPPRQAVQARGVPALHLLCDRDLPVKAVKTFRGPVMVLIIVGDTHQAHHLLVRRLRVFELSSAFGPVSDGATNRQERTVYARDFNMPDDFGTPEQFKRDLEEEVVGSARGSLATVAGQMHDKGDIVLLDTEMDYSDWTNHGQAKVEAFLEFFKDMWPHPEGDRRLVVCLSIRFDLNQPSDWWNRVFLARRISKELFDLRRRRPELLPDNRVFEIKGVARDEARRWRKEDSVREALATRAIHHDDLLNPLDQLHHRLKSRLTQRAPMESFAANLRKLVEDLVNDPQTRSQA